MRKLSPRREGLIIVKPSSDPGARIFSPIVVMTVALEYSMTYPRIFALETESAQVGPIVLPP